MDISYTCQYSGNEVAEKLAKEAAAEASQRPDDKRYTTFMKIREASRKTQIIRWQTKWDTTEQGRTHHTFVPSVDRKRVFDTPGRKGFYNILHLQTGFSKLNEYRHKLGQCEDDRCQCGEHETTDHFINHCPTYEQHRNTLWLKSIKSAGNPRTQLTPSSEWRLEWRDPRLVRSY